MTHEEPRRIIVAITGASGAAYGIRMLQRLRDVSDVETHLIVSRGGALTIHSETQYRVSDVGDLADVVHQAKSIGASIASGSFPVAGMIVAPCSMRTLGAVVGSLSDSLVVRAADVTLKEGRPLILLVRESPLHLGHLRLMTAAVEMGAVIAPPVPAFYMRPSSVSEVVDHTVSRTLMRLGLSDQQTPRWEGLKIDAPDTQ